MKIRSIRNTLFLVFIFLAGYSLAAPADPKGAPVEIVSAEFGIFDDSNPLELVFEPTRVVPHRIGQRYGWTIEVRTSRRAVSVQEEYVLPNPSKTKDASDPVSESLNVPAQRRNQVSQRQLVPVEGKIYGEWAIGSSEPAGHRQLQVIIEGQVAASFEFDVR